MARSVYILFHHRLEVGLVWCVIFTVFTKKRRDRGSKKKYIYINENKPYVWENFCALVSDWVLIDWWLSGCKRFEWNLFFSYFSVQESFVAGVAFNSLCASNVQWWSLANIFRRNISNRLWHFIIIVQVIFT